MMKKLKQVKIITNTPVLSSRLFLKKNVLNKKKNGIYK